MFLKFSFRVNLKIDRGELFGVVGGNGVGKSALISAILGDIEKRKGRVIVRVRLLVTKARRFI